MKQRDVLRAGCNSPPAVMGGNTLARERPGETGCQQIWVRSPSRRYSPDERERVDGPQGPARHFGRPGPRPRSRNPEETWLRKDRNEPAFLCFPQRRPAGPRFHDCREPGARRQQHSTIPTTDAGAVWWLRHGLDWNGVLAIPDRHGSYTTTDLAYRHQESPHSPPPR